MERLPYQATAAAAAYDGIGKLPVSLLLDNVRSMYNVGAFFRAADGAGIERLYLSGITPPAEKRGVAKTALGAEQTVSWERTEDPSGLLRDLAARGHQIAAIETSVHAVDLFDWKPAFPVCLVFGHEVDGIQPEIVRLCEVHIRIPMLGAKHSLNVATAGGVVMYELLRKYRALCRAALY